MDFIKTDLYNEVFRKCGSTLQISEELAVGVRRVVQGAGN
jgi:hypothetical protein